METKEFEEYVKEVFPNRDDLVVEAKELQGGSTAFVLHTNYTIKGFLGRKERVEEELQYCPLAGKWGIVYCRDGFRSRHEDIKAALAEAVNLIDKVVNEDKYKQKTIRFAPSLANSLSKGKTVFKSKGNEISAEVDIFTVKYVWVGEKTPYFVIENLLSCEECGGQDIEFPTLDNALAVIEAIKANSRNNI